MAVGGVGPASTTGTRSRSRNGAKVGYLAPADAKMYRRVMQLAPPESALTDPSDDVCDLFGRLLEQQAPPS